MRIRFQVWFVLSLMFAGVESRADDQHTASKPLLFNQQYKGLTRYSLLQGPTLYQEVSDKFTEGYRVERSEVIDGMFSREVYDYGKSQSALSLYKQARQQLLAEGFDLSFECIGIECGPVSGWKLLFSSDIAGETESQFYLAGRLGTENQAIAGKAIYVTEFDAQPRLIVDTIQRVAVEAQRQDMIGRFGDMFDNWQHTGSLLSLGSVYFGTNSDQPQNMGQIAKLLTELKANPTSTYLLIGFADPRGASAVNKALSLDRANKLKEQLMDQYKMEIDNLVTYGAGELTIANQSLASSRRVSVYRFKD